MVAEGGVPRDRQPLGLERPTGRVEQPGHHREAPLAAREVIRQWETEPGGRAVRVPVVRVVVRRVAVVHALPPGQVARVDAHLAAVQDVDVPPHLVELGVVGVVAGLDRERQRLAGHRAGRDLVEAADHRVGDLAGEHLLRSVGRGEQPCRRHRAVVVEPVGPLHPHRRLGVDDVHVAELGERDQRLALAGTVRGRRAAEVGANPVRLTGRRDDRAVAPGPGGAAGERAREGRPVGRC